EISYLLRLKCMHVYFFFQAEDGIRDFHVTGVQTCALPISLVTKSDGTKFGKTEGGAVWLAPDMMSPYAFYQFWLNTEDADVLQFLKSFTFRNREEIEELAEEVAERPFARQAQRTLARDVTALVHGPAAMERVERASQALF